MSIRIILVTMIGLAVSTAAAASNTVTCTQKRHWQRQVVEVTVDRWFEGEVRPDDFIDLIQSEQGIAACVIGRGTLPRLHTSTIPADLDLNALGAILLVNELRWSELLPQTEEGLAGRRFQVLPSSLGGGSL